MKIRLFNPNFEDFQTNLGICYLFIFGIPCKKPDSSSDNLNLMKKDSTNKEMLVDNPFRPLPKSTSKDSDSLTSGKISLEKFDNNNNIQKILKERLSGVNETNVKTLFKDRSGTKDEKFYVFF